MAKSKQGVLSKTSSRSLPIRKSRCWIDKMAEGALTKAVNKKYPGFTYETEGRWQGPFCFIHAADTQFGLIDSWNAVPLAEQTWEKEIVLTRKAISAANKLSPKPRFFVVCGDLVNAFPWEKYNDPQVKDFKKIFTELDPSIPLICVCGNHDVGDSPTQESLQKYRNNFGDDFYSFWVGGKDCFKQRFIR